MYLLHKYKKCDLRTGILSLTFWKIKITTDGISSSFNQEDLDKVCPNIKTKYAIKKPKSCNSQVYDESHINKIIPSEAIIVDGQNRSSIIKLRYNPKSQIKLILSKNKKIFFKIQTKNKSQKLPFKIVFLKKTPKGCVSLVGKDRLSINLFEGCWNWNNGDPCHFCDLNPKRKDYKSLIPSLNELVDFNFDYKKWWKFHKDKYIKNLSISLQQMKQLANPHKHLLIMAGCFIDNNYLWKILMDVLRGINKKINLNEFDTLLNVSPPTKNIKNKLQKIKKLGIKQVEFNLEVPTKKDFKDVCPGKDKLVGYKIFKKTLEISAEIFGLGHSRSNFVFTKNSSKSLILKAKKLAKKGIVLDYSIFQPKRGTPWEKKDNPSVDEIIFFNTELVKIYKKYNFQAIYCPLSSRSSVINEFLEYEK